MVFSAFWFFLGFRKKKSHLLIHIVCWCIYSIHKWFGCILMKHFKIIFQTNFNSKTFHYVALSKVISAIELIERLHIKCPIQINTKHSLLSKLISRCDEYHTQWQNVYFCLITVYVSHFQFTIQVILIPRLLVCSTVRPLSFNWIEFNW